MKRGVTVNRARTASDPLIKLKPNDRNDKNWLFIKMKQDHLEK